MQYRPLGHTGLKVSAICLGTMTWGEQNTEAAGHAQMDFALDRGVNFWDTAEMYPVPARAETYGRTEEIIGAWFKSRGGRERVILASKAIGPDGTRFHYIRDGNPRFTREQIRDAVDGSLRRLQTDYIDLYQLHWPERSTNNFGKLGYVHSAEEEWTPFAETLDALHAVIKAGKVRYIGLSNESAWGVMRWLALAERDAGPRMQSVQNPYSLLNRSFEVGLAEVAIREGCGLLAYSPLAMGALSGKYLDGARPEGARLTLYKQFQRYRNSRSSAAVAAYVALARAAGIDPAQMALAFVNAQPFVTSNIIGATNLAQLAANIASIEVTLAPDLMQAIGDIHKTYTYPSP